MKRSGYAIIGLITLITSGLIIIKDKLSYKPVKKKLYEEDNYIYITGSLPAVEKIQHQYKFLRSTSSRKVFCFSCNKCHETGQSCARSSII
jgi:hypothetical protein